MFPRGPNFLKVLEYWGLFYCIDMDQQSEEMERLTGKRDRARRYERPQDIKWLCGPLERVFRGDFTHVPLLHKPP